MSAPTLIEKLYNAEREARPAIIAIPDAAARDVIRQLATKPLWDGDLNSKKQDDKPDDREKQDDSEVFTVNLHLEQHHLKDSRQRCTSEKCEFKHRIFTKAEIKRRGERKTTQRR